MSNLPFLISPEGRDPCVWRIPARAPGRRDVARESKRVEASKAARILRASRVSSESAPLKSKDPTLFPLGAPAGLALGDRRASGRA